MNQTQPILLSQPHREGKRTQNAQIALRSFGAKIEDWVSEVCDQNGGRF